MWLFGEVDLSQFERSILMFRWALTVIGSGVALTGVAMYFYRPREKARVSPKSARLAALVSFGLIGVATILYAWLWFGQ
ncbi:MAG: hypothetical protein VX768_06015 [Planctomycetota bacterium]|nr:hypothetical protein [Planctomycetota bacterium]